jgi:23S rRNA pseudouridine2605 synthase
MTPDDQGIRLNRYLARAGHGSRRAVEDLITAGRVTIGGKVVTDLGRRVDPEHDHVAVDGRPVTIPEDTRVYAFHKPFGVTCTLKAQAGQDDLREWRHRADLPERFVPVGRLDQTSTGLLLWTDDGALNQALCRPRSGVWKSYEIELAMPLPEELLPTLTDGSIELDGRPCLPCLLHPGRRHDGRHWVMELHEGRNRQVRRMFAALGQTVTRLHRVAFGPVLLGLLRAGDFRRLNAAELTALRAAAEAEDKNRSRGGKKAEARKPNGPRKPGGPGRPAGPRKPGGPSRPAGDRKPAGTRKPTRGDD